MGFLDKLKFTTVEKPAQVDRFTPVERARRKMIAGLEVQLAIVEAHDKGSSYTITRNKRDGTTVEKKPRNWCYHVGGKIYMDLKYGNKALMIDGKNTIEVGDGGNVVRTINLIMDAVKAGELDKEILAASESSGRGKKTARGK